MVSLNHHKGDQKQKKVGKMIKLGCKNINKMFTFASSLNLKTVHSMNMKENMVNNVTNRGAEELVAAHVGNTEVLLINDHPHATTLSSTQKCGIVEEKSDHKVDSEKTKSFSKIKELLKWAAATKAEKGGKFVCRKVKF